jgi:ferredoxin-type protein NapG
MDRRRFFREGLRELLKPLANAVQPIEKAIEQLGQLENAVSTTSGAFANTKPKPRPPDPWLRPPGSIEEMNFREVCSRCGVCVNVCPAQCIKIDPTGKKGHGAPYIEPDVMPCVVCDGLVCMRACPSGAIVPTALGLLDLGTAEWRADFCVRRHGEDCQICVDQCPIGSVAIRVCEGRIDVIEDGCIGCGVCEHACPTTPKSIVVIPKAARG